MTNPRFTGRKHTPETKAKMAVAARRRYEDPAEREKTAESLRGELNPNWGRTPSDETRAKLSAAVRLRYEDPAARAKVSAASRGRKHTAETKAKMSVAQRGELNGNWKGDDICSTNAHYRHRKVLPKVCARADGTCKGRIEAAFNHDTPAEFVRVDPATGSPYSIRPEDYMALCHSHHVRYDKRNRKGVQR